MPDEEKRRSPRYPVENLSGTFHVSAPVRIVNLSLTGMAVETAAPLRVGRVYSMTLRHGADEALDLQGVVVWCQLRPMGEQGDSDGRAVYVAGIEFDETLTERASSLLRFLEHSAVIDLHTRIAGRFAVLDRTSADLRIEHAFLVRTISRHGVFLESEFSAPVDSVVDLELDLEGELVRTRGRVAFARQASVEDKQRISQLGVEFVHLDGSGQDVLERFIAKLIR